MTRRCGDEPEDRQGSDGFSAPAFPDDRERLTQALGEELTSPQSQAHSYGTGPAGGAGGARSASGAKTGGMRHGHASKKDEVESDTERFFRAVDRGIHEHHSKPTGLPLILAALPEYHATFRSISHNTQLVDSGVEMNAEALSADEFRHRAWKVMEPVYLNRLADLVERFGAASTSGRGDDRLPQVSEVAASGRVATLLLEAGRQAPGRLGGTTGAALQPGELSHPAVDDMFDDLAERVIRNGGEVVMVPPERMPSTTGLAAIYRF